MKKPLVDIEDINKEFKILNDNLSLLGDCFLAVAMDYTHYVDNSWGQKEVFKLRDSVAYRFFSAKLHVELLIKQHFEIEYRFKQYLKTEPNAFAEYFSKNPYYDHAEKEISSIFDSFLYHLVSVFDYLGTLTNYVCGPKEDKQKTLKWTNLARSARDSENYFGKKPIADVIKEFDNVFVNKLYSYRSYLIHEKAELSMYSFTYHFSNNSEQKVTANFIATERLTKQFPELKSLSKDNYLSIKYVSFWILNRAIEIITDMLFALKNEMEQNPKVPFGFFAYFDEKSKMGLPASTPYWEKVKHAKERKIQNGNI